MENKNFYVRSNSGLFDGPATREKISKSEYDVSNKYCFIKDEKGKVLVHKSLSHSFEPIIAIDLDYKTPSQTSLEGPDLKNISSYKELLEILKDHYPINICTKETGEIQVNCENDFKLFDRYVGSIEIPKNVIIEETPESLKVKLFKKVISLNELDNPNRLYIVSFGKDHFTRHYKPSYYSEKLEGDIVSRKDYDILDDFDEDILNDIAKCLHDFREHVDGVKYDMPKAFSVSLRDFNLYPSFPNKSMFSQYVAVKNTNDKNEIVDSIIKKAKFEDSEFVKNKLLDNNFTEADFRIFIFSKVLYENNVASFEESYNIFKKFENDIYPFVTGIGDTYLQITDRAIKACLKYRKPEEILEAFSKIDSFTFDIFRSIDWLEDVGAFNGNAFDRLAYNKFNKYANSLTDIFAKEYLVKSIEDKLKDGSEVINFEGLDFVRIDTATFKNFANVSSGGTPWRMPENKFAVIINGEPVICANHNKGEPYILYPRFNTKVSPSSPFGIKEIDDKITRFIDSVPVPPSHSEETPDFPF